MMVPFDTVTIWQKLCSASFSEIIRNWRIPRPGRAAYHFALVKLTTCSDADFDLVAPLSTASVESRKSAPEACRGSGLLRVLFRYRSDYRERLITIYRRLKRCAGKDDCEAALSDKDYLHSLALLRTSCLKASLGVKLWNGGSDKHRQRSVHHACRAAALTSKGYKSRIGSQRTPTPPASQSSPFNFSSLHDLLKATSLQLRALVAPQARTETPVQVGIARCPAISGTVNHMDGAKATSPHFSMRDSTINTMAPSATLEACLDQGITGKCLRTDGSSEAASMCSFAKTLADGLARFYVR